MTNVDEIGEVDARPERTYVVKGRWPFPTPMLEKDFARPATEEDRIAIERMSRPHVDDKDDLSPKEITLISRERPNTARWESFRWSVPGDEEHAFLKSERARRGREEALLKSALDKLDADERALIMSMITKSGER